MPSDKEAALDRAASTRGRGSCFRDGQVLFSREEQVSLAESVSLKQAQAPLSPGELCVPWAKLGFPSPCPGTGWPERPTPGSALRRAGPGRCLGSPEATLGQTRRGSGLLELMATLECTTTQHWGQGLSFLGLRD